MGLLNNLTEALSGGINEFKQTSSQIGGGILKYLNEGANIFERKRDEFYQPTENVRVRDIVRETTNLE